MSRKCPGKSNEKFPSFTVYHVREAAVLEALERPPEIPFADESNLWQFHGDILLGGHGVLLGNSDSTVKLFGYLIYVSIFPLMHENGIYNGIISYPMMFHSKPSRTNWNRN